MRTTIALPEPLLQSAKREASESGTTLSELLANALRFYLARKPSQVVAPFRLHTVRGKLVQPELDLDRTSVLETIDDESKFEGLRK